MEKSFHPTATSENAASSQNQPFPLERPAPAPPQKFSRILEIISAVILLGGIVYFVFSDIGLPDRVPVHFGSNGQADSWGSKSESLIGPLILSGSTLLILVLARFPHMHNVPIAPRTEAGWQRSYTLTRNMLLWMSCGMGAMVWNIAYSTSHPDGGNLGFLLCLALILLPVVYYIFKLVSVTKKDCAGEALR
ncbi:MAG: DUF1648 domain-containing protein [Rothia sp. (in: high G+C Gram-positive bacteria)]|nr:DUF1648 domain-containing protein [Rothia sp. (in: high G+C Gram-positive bacteria)]